MGIISNVDVNLSDEDRKKAEKIERDVAIVNEAIEETPAVQYNGELTPARDTGAVTIPEGQLKYQLRDYRYRRDNNIPVVPVNHFIDSEGDIRWVLNDEDAAACEAGYLCENCLSWQESTITLKCKARNGFSCGYERTI